MAAFIEVNPNVFINVEHIVHFGKSADGESIGVMLSNGEVVSNSFKSFEEFRSEIEEKTKKL